MSPNGVFFLGELFPSDLYGTLTAVSDKGWVGWATENRLLVGAIALVTAVSLTVVAVVASHSGSSSKKKVASNSKVEAGTGVEPGANTTESTLAGGAVVRARPETGETPDQWRRSTKTTGPSVTGPRVTVPGGVTLPSCASKAGFTATGLDEKSVTIGRSSPTSTPYPRSSSPTRKASRPTSTSSTPPAACCGRKININYENDNLNPATHDFQGMAKKVFAFVANSSLLDGNDYDSAPPFNPKYSDNGQFLPDVGGSRIRTAGHSRHGTGARSAASRRPWAAGWRSR